MLGLIAVFAVLLAITMLTGKPSADGEYTSVVYATALSLLPPVIAIGLALFTKEIDATAAPVCIIAPISSWAAAVTSSVPADSGINGFAVFIQTIPYNLYAILTLVMLLTITVLRVDFGPMKNHEMNAIAGDLFTTPGRPYEDNEEKSLRKTLMYLTWCFQ